MPVEILVCLKMDGEGRVSKGWSEKHLHLSDPDDLEELDADMRSLASARLDCAAENVWISEVRASRPGLPRDSYRVWTKQSGDPNATLDGQGSIAGMMADPSNTCLNVNIRANDSQNRTLYLAGIPDALIKTAPAGPDGAAVPAFARGFRKLRNLLLNGRWGFKARALFQSSFAAQIYDWSVQPDAPYELVAKIHQEDAFGQPGDQVQVRGVHSEYFTARLPNGKWNIRSTVTVGTEYQITLRNATGFDPTMWDKYGTIEPIVYQYPAYKKMFIVGQATRKRGVGPIRPRGRSSPRRRR